MCLKSNTNIANVIVSICKHLLAKKHSDSFSPFDDQKIKIVLLFGLWSTFSVCFDDIQTAISFKVFTVGISVFNKTTISSWFELVFSYEYAVWRLPLDLNISCGFRSAGKNTAWRTESCVHRYSEYLDG